MLPARIALAVGSAAVLLLVVLGTSPVSANFNVTCQYGDHIPCAADSTHHIYFYDGVGPLFRESIENSRTGTFEAVPGWTTAVTTFHGSSDVHYLYDNVPGGVGSALCSTINSAGRCDHWHVRVDIDEWQANTTEYDLTAYQRQALACHETGHTTGLLHSTGSATFRCMVQGYPKDSAFLGAHNVNHLANDPIYN